MPSQTRPMKYKNHKYLIISTKGLGNAVELTPLLRYLDDRGIRYDLVLANKYAADLVLSMGIKKPDRIIFWQKSASKIKNLTRVISEVREQKYSLAVATYPAGAKEVIILRFAKAHSKKMAKYRGGFLRFAQFLFPFAPSPSPEMHEVEINASLIGIPIEVLRQKQVILKRNKIPKIGFHVGSKGEGKRWTPEKWGKLADKLAQRYNAEFFLLAGPDEANLVEKIKQNSRVKFKELVGTEFPYLVQQIKEFSILVGNDSVGAHIAAVLGIPTVAIWAYSSLYRPIPYGKGSYIITRDYECIPCYRVTKGYPENCKYNFRCIRNTGVDEVFHVVDAVLSSANLPGTEVLKKIPHVVKVEKREHGAYVITFKDAE